MWLWLASGYWMAEGGDPNCAVDAKLYRGDGIEAAHADLQIYWNECSTLNGELKWRWLFAFMIGLPWHLINSIADYYLDH